MEFLPEILEDKSIINMLGSKINIHVAVLVKRNKLIAMATNKVGSRSRGAGWSDCSIHAEKNVVRELGDFNKMNGASMYVFRISSASDKIGLEKIQNSVPCHDCHLFLEKCVREYGLMRIFYSTNQFVELDLALRPRKKIYTVSIRR